MSRFVTLGEPKMNDDPAIKFEIKNNYMQQK